MMKNKRHKISSSRSGGCLGVVRGLALWGAIVVTLIAYAVLMPVWLTAFEGFAGDLLLFVPSVLVMIPPVLAWLVAVVVKPGFRRLGLALPMLGALPFLAGLHIPFGASAPGGGVELRIVTANRGQDQGTRLSPFINKEGGADLVLLQEAWDFQKKEGKHFPKDEWHYNRDRNFVLYSRYPILKAEQLPKVKRIGDHEYIWVAMRYELELEPEMVIAVYNIHFPSPRDVLQPMRGRVLKDTLKGGGLFSMQTQEMLTAEGRVRRIAYDGVLERLEEEKLPFIIAGDFNSPAGGVIHREVGQYADDGFAAAGVGFGWTFPGKSALPLTGYGPAQRIDYIYVSDHFTPLEAKVQPESEAQHRSVRLEVVLNL